MNRLEGKILLRRIIFVLFLWVHIANGEIYRAEDCEPLRIKISKSGLNRITNPPYRITQVTGDEGKFRLKYDEDGTNIYIIPLAGVGENIEISIRNNVGSTLDLELLVSNIKGRSIIIDGKTDLNTDRGRKSDIADMLRAMKDNVSGKFYVRQGKRELDNIGALKVTQSKTYKYKNLAGGIFEVTNPTKTPITLDVSILAKRFDNVKSFYPDLSTIEPKKSITVFVVQGQAGN